MVPHVGKVRRLGCKNCRVKKWGRRTVISWWRCGPGSMVIPWGTKVSWSVERSRETKGTEGEMIRMIKTRVAHGEGGRDLG